MQEGERPPADEALDEQVERRGEQNEVGYRIVDEEVPHDERPGTQGPGPGDPPADED